MRQPLEDPAVLANKAEEKQETLAEQDSRSLIKRLLTFGLTDQVLVFVFVFSLVNEMSIYHCNILCHFQGSESDVLA